MSKFTEGKWKINEYCDVLAENNQLVALTNGPRNKKETQANARLIAAAPEMYQHLKLILNGEFSSDDVEQLLARIDGEEQA